MQLQHGQPPRCEQVLNPLKHTESAEPEAAQFAGQASRLPDDATRLDQEKDHEHIPGVLREVLSSLQQQKAGLLQVQASKRREHLQAQN